MKRLMFCFIVIVFSSLFLTAFNVTSAVSLNAKKKAKANGINIKASEPLFSFRKARIQIFTDTQKKRVSDLAMSSLVKEKGNWYRMLIKVENYDILEAEGYNIQHIRHTAKPLDDKLKIASNVQLNGHGFPTIQGDDGDSYSGDYSFDSDYSSGVCLSPDNSWGQAEYRFYLDKGTDYDLEPGIYGKDTGWVGDGVWLSLYNWETSDYDSFINTPKAEQYTYFSVEDKGKDSDDYVSSNYQNMYMIVYADGLDKYHIDYVDCEYWYEPQRFTLDTHVSPSGSGSVTGGGTYDSGTEVTVEANPNLPCWHFDHWSGDLSGSSNPTTITMNEDKDVTAHFEINQAVLTTSIQPSEAENDGCSISLNPSGGTYDCGTVVTVEANPNPSWKWKFDHWSGNLSGSSNPTTITMNEDKDVIANFVRKTGSLTVTINPLEVRQYARWRLTSGPDSSWKESGQTISGIPTGDYILQLKSVSGWNEPSDKTVTISEGSNSESGTYVRKTGSLTVTIDGPPEARWRLTSGPDTNWNRSGETISNIPTGSYTLQFKSVSGWNKPSDKTVHISEGSNSESGTYVRKTGSLTVTINPSEVRDEARWRLTSGPDTSWKESGEAISNIPTSDYPPTGDYTLQFKSVSGWERPSDKTVHISEGSNSESGTYVDTVPPTGTISINNGEETTTSRSVTLNLSATDNGSGVDKMRFKNESDSWESWESYSTSKSWMLSSGDGTKKVSVQYKDKAGNESSTYNDSITLDTTSPPAPIISSSTHTEGVWSNNDDPSFTWTDPTDTSGINGYSHEFDNSPSTTPNTTSEGTSRSKSYSDQANGTWYFHVRAQDGAGNWGNTDHYGPVKIDDTPPNNPPSCTETHGVQSGVEQSSVNDPDFIWSGASDSASGVNGYYYYWGTNSNGTSSNYNKSASYDPPEVSEDTYYLRAKTKDNAGNEASWKTLFVFIYSAPNTPPTISGLPDKTFDEDGSLNNTIDLWAYAEDAETPDSGLTFAITDNTNQNCGVSIDSDRYIDIDPAANWHGYSDVTVEVTDPEGLSSDPDDTFRIKVNSVNDKPTIASTIPNQSADKNTPIIIDLTSYESDVEDSGTALDWYAEDEDSCTVSGEYSDNDILTFTPNSNFVGDDYVTLYLKDSGGLTDNQQIKLTWIEINHPPNTPTNISPVDAAIDISLIPTLQSSAFSDPDTADTHQASQWQITTTPGDYSTPVYDSGVDTVNKADITVPAGVLSNSTTYYWHVRHQDNNNAWSNYSSETSFTTEQGQSITLTAPNGGECIKGGSSYNVTWNTSGSGIDHISLLYSTDSGNTYPNTIVASTDDDGTHPWTTPEIDSAKVRVKAEAYDVSNNSLAEDESDNDFTIDSTPPETTITLSSPEGKNGWYTSDVIVELSAIDNLCDVKEIKYKIGSGSWETYSSAFTISSEGTTTVYYRSEDKAVGSPGNIEAEKSQEIKIDKTPPSVALTSPNGGEGWEVGTTHNITWTAEDTTSDIASIKLEYSIDSGSTWKPEASGEENDGEYLWTIPDDESERCRVKVTAYDNASNEAKDESDNDFAIPPQVLGDVSGNGYLSAYDAALIFQHLSGLIELSEEQQDRGDVSGDGSISAYDADLILKKVVGLIPKFPVESGD